MAYINYSACSTESFSLSQKSNCFGEITPTLLQNNNSSPCTRPQRPVPESLINVNLPLRTGPNNSTKANVEIYCTSSFLITMQFRHSMPQSFYQGVEWDWFKLEERKHYKDAGKAESSASVLSKAFRCILQAWVISVGALTDVYYFYTFVWGLTRS